MGRRKAGCLAAAAVLLAAGAYVADGHDASQAALAAMEGAVHHGHAEAFVPQGEAKAGLIFYPGGKVDHRAYAPLMRALSDRDILCLLVQMPLDLAVLDVNAADGLQGLYPQVESWMIGGHSLGGAMAAGYAAEHAGAYDALVLLGAYAASDVSGAQLSVLSVYGTEDGVLNRGKYERSRAHYPDEFTEVVIEGGCHAYFGDYGAQEGDGVPAISREEQIEQTANAIAALIKE